MKTSSTINSITELEVTLRNAHEQGKDEIYLTVSEDISFKNLENLLYEMFYSVEISGKDYTYDNDMESILETIADCNVPEYYNSEDNTKEGEYECKVLLTEYTLPLRYIEEEIVIDIDFFETYKSKRYHWSFDCMDDEEFEEYEECEEDFQPHAMAFVSEYSNKFNENGEVMDTETLSIERIYFDTIDELFDEIRDCNSLIKKESFFETIKDFLDKNPVFNTDFLKLLLSHKEEVIKSCKAKAINLIEAAYEHDMDKIFNEETYKIYAEHFAKLKSIPFTSSDYKEYEEKHFPQAHYNHNQEAHQFYDYRHEADTEVDLMLLQEVVTDITVTAKAYGNTDVESIAKIIHNKGSISELVSYEVILNSVKKVFYNK